MFYIGWIGGILLAWCGFPEVIHSIKTKECNLTWGMLSSWGIGEICLFIYVAPSMDLPLLLNYGLNVVFIGILCYYKIRSKK